MRILPEDIPVLDGIEARGGEIISRAGGWCAVNSGSRHLGGLERQRALLDEVLQALPGKVERVPLEPSQEIANDGSERRQPQPDALRLTVRPEAEVQVILTGHYDTVYPAESPFQAVRDRAAGALWGPGIADMKGGISVMLAALAAFETHPIADRLGYTALLSPDEETGSLASAPLLAELGAAGHVGMTYAPALAAGTL